MWSCHSTVEARSHGSLASSLSEWGEVTRPSRREQPRSLTSFTYLGCYLPVSMSVVRGKWWEGDGLGFLFPSLIVTYAQPIIITFLPIISRSLRSLLMMKDMIMWRGSRGSSFTLEPTSPSVRSDRREERITCHLSRLNNVKWREMNNEWKETRKMACDDKKIKFLS